MSLAGKPSFIEKVRSLLQKKQAPSLSAPAAPARRDKSLSDKEIRQLDKLTQVWVSGRGYRMPDRSVEDAARRIGTSSVLLHRYCLQRLGKDFRSWRTELRMEDAKQMLLEDSTTTASNVGRRVGVSDRSNFFRQFTAYTGCSPDQWRKQQKG